VPSAPTVKLARAARGLSTGAASGPRLTRALIDRHHCLEFSTAL